MAKFSGEQLSLIAESEFEHRPVGDWDYDELGTEIFSVPNFLPGELGTNKTDVSVIDYGKLGTEIFPVPNFYEPPRQIPHWDDPIEPCWKPPIGGLDRKWIKDRQYWCWRYYDTNGKKRSIHLHKDYNKAVRKCLKIGIPANAKLPKSKSVKTDPQIPTPTVENLIDITQTAHGASRNFIAA
jgi:hypothetical protein